MASKTKAVRRRAAFAQHKGAPAAQKSGLGSRAKLLKAAEQLFSENGFKAVSIRDIAAAAGVNSALIAYYFGSKEQLFVSVYRAVAEPINAERMRRFDALAATGRTLTVEEIVEAWVRPALIDYIHTEHAVFAKLAVALSTYDPAMSDHLSAITFEEVNLRFLAALEQALPGISRPTLVWRLYFLVGALMMVARQRRSGMSRLSNGECRADDGEELVRELLAFVSAGFRAPLPRA